MTYETDTWPFVAARWFTKVDPAKPRKVRLVVVHDMEFPEKKTAAEEIAQDFATATDKRSAHLCIDCDSIVQCVHDRDVAYAAPGCNNDGIQIELAGYGRQTREQWLDSYGQMLLERGADATAQYCLKYDLQVKHLSNDELRSGERGIVGHYQASAVYKQSDHQDPGPYFPWDVFIGRVQWHYDNRKLSHGVTV